MTGLKSQAVARPHPHLEHLVQKIPAVDPNVSILLLLRLDPGSPDPYDPPV